MEYLIKSGYYMNGRYKVVVDYDNNLLTLFSLDFKLENIESIKSYPLDRALIIYQGAFTYKFANGTFVFEFHREFNKEDLEKIKDELTLFKNKETLFKEREDDNARDGEYIMGHWWSRHFKIITYKDKKILLREEDPKIMLFNQIKISREKQDSGDALFGYITDTSGLLIKSYRFSHIASLDKIIGFKSITDEEKEQIINEIMSSEDPSYQTIKKRLLSLNH